MQPGNIHLTQVPFLVARLLFPLIFRLLGAHLAIGARAGRFPGAYACRKPGRRPLQQVYASVRDDEQRQPLQVQRGAIV